MSYTDWIPTMELIENKNELSIIEFGLGNGTNFLVENFKTVYSYELASSKDWFNHIYSSLSQSHNWQGEFSDFTEFEFGSYSHNIPVPLLDKVIGLFKTKYDVVFMDGGFHNPRGYLANFILSEIQPDYLIVHDINDSETYSYGEIVCPEQYLFKDDLEGEGTRIYFKKGKL
jgi:hypothetical protein